ncbi:MAG: bifunctional phosphopantothenoylcysteine decarboxylase/phosphopantothenate--cysteine ligase CoaBC [Eubacteriales bacterium]
MFLNRCVVLGVTGGIAAYKAASLVRLLSKENADVHVIMTKNATKFITPLTLETLSTNKVIKDTFEEKDNYDILHVSLAKSADILLVAPATANFIAKVASGIADDMLSTTFLAAKCIKIIAPAMNEDMYLDKCTQENIEKLKNSGVIVLNTGKGHLACGEEGRGRMLEPEDILNAAKQAFLSRNEAAGINILVNAGPTREYIDPIRFISSPSSGKMGYALAEAAADLGAKVTLVSGPVSIPAPRRVKMINVVSASEMYNKCFLEFEDADIVIASAAVSDYTPKEVHNKKVKKAGELDIAFVRTKDILRDMGQKKGNKMLVGFAAETHDVLNYALSKLDEKNLDMVCLNDISKSGIGFGSDNNHVIMCLKDGSKIDLGLLTKKETAKLILEKVISLYTQMHK